jgi:plastocyanin
VYTTSVDVVIPRDRGSCSKVQPRNRPVPRNAPRALVGIRRLVAALGALALVLVGCSGSSGGASSRDGATRATTTRAAPAARIVAVAGNALRFSPDEITVRTREEITIAFTAQDTRHTFDVEGVRARVMADAGQTRQVRIRVAKPGRYRFFCAIPGHRTAGMQGSLVIAP